MARSVSGTGFQLPESFCRSMLASQKGNISNQVGAITYEIHVAYGIQARKFEKRMIVTANGRKGETALVQPVDFPDPY